MKFPLIKLVTSAPLITWFGATLETPVKSAFEITRVFNRLLLITTQFKYESERTSLRSLPGVCGSVKLVTDHPDGSAPSATESNDSRNIELPRLIFTHGATVNVNWLVMFGVAPPLLLNAIL